MSNIEKIKEFINLKYDVKLHNLVIFELDKGLLHNIYLLKKDSGINYKTCIVSEYNGKYIISEGYDDYIIFNHAELNELLTIFPDIQLRLFIKIEDQQFKKYLLEMANEKNR